MPSPSLPPLSPDSSEAKYDSGTGWPAFKEAHGTWGKDESHASIIRRPDNSLGSAATEILCKNVSYVLDFISVVSFLHVHVIKSSIIDWLCIFDAV